MYKHILIYTDGSRLSRKTLVAGIRLAKLAKGRVTVLYGVERFDPMIYAEGYVAEPAWVEDYERSSREHGKSYLRRAEQLAEKSGVSCTTRLVTVSRPYQEIISTARSRDCDTIVMPSRGRKGLTAMLLGSETLEVLSRCKRPVLVVR